MFIGCPSWKFAIPFSDLGGARVVTNFIRTLKVPESLGADRVTKRESDYAFITVDYAPASQESFMSAV
jgi:hypothetical protein